MNSKVLVALATVWLTGASSLFGQNDSPVSFNLDIRPVLADRCFACHGPDAESRQAGLRLDVAVGPEGAHGSAISPGSVEDSELWHRITSDDEDVRMPPPDSHRDRLTPQQIETFRQWVMSGANYDGFWAFESLRRPPLPKIRQAAWSDHPVDLYVLRKLESVQRHPSDEADDRTLVRRVTFDLTGLPPTLDQIEDFLDDRKSDPVGAWERLVDRLLASNRFGEHMARYWLDLVRFADTNGMHKDFYRNHIALSRLGYSGL